MRIYLDLCSLQRPLDDLSQIRVRVEAEAILAILSLVEAGAAELVNSAALEFEAARNPVPLRRQFSEQVLASAACYIPASDSVVLRARKYIDSGIKALDALHVAAAVEASAAYFCTCDDRLLRRARSLDTGNSRCVTPLELIQETGL